MKKILFLLFACSMAFAQVDYTGLSDSEDAAYAELDRETQDGDTLGGSVWEQPIDKSSASSGFTADVTVKESSPVSVEPSTSSVDPWEEEWRKRRINVSFFMGFFPVTSLGAIIADIFDEIDGEDDFEPDLMAYSVGVGYELFYLLEVGLMVDYTTIGPDPLVSVIPRIKLNWLNFKYFRLYSYAGLGAIFWDDGAMVMFNFALLGFEAGNHLSVFFEGGWGQVGLFTLGIKLAF